MKNQHNNKNTESNTYLQYFEAKLQKTSLISNQHKNVCGQLIMDYLKNIGCNDKVLTDLNTILFTNNHSQKGNQSLSHPLQSLVQEKYGNSIENQLQDAISHLYKPKQRQRIPHHERIKQHSLNYNAGQDYQLPEQIRRLKTCFGHALHPDNQDQEDPYIPIYNILYDKSGQFLITGDDMGLIKIWSSSTGLLLQSLKGHTMAINSMDISHCNKYLATCSNDGLVLLWEIQSAKPIAAIKDFQDDPILVLLFLYIDDEKNYLYVATEKGYLYIYRFQDLVACNGGMLGTQFNTKSRKSSITHHADVVRVSGKKQNGILCMEFNKQGYLVIGTEQGEILIWESPEQLVDGELNHIIWKEHIKECHLAKWNTTSDMLMTASFDGTAKLWNWQQGGLDQNINNKSQVTLKYKNKSRRVGETSCLAIAWSCRNSYALASFSKKLKQRGDEDNARTQIQVYDLTENKIISFLDGEQFWPGLMDYPIFILEAHPHDEQIALSADQNGFIIIWNIIEQEIIKVFHERGYHMKLPNLEVPLLDGCFSPTGLQFVVSSDFGSFSIYGYGSSEIFEQTPVEQFFVSDSIHPIIDDTHGFKIMSLDSDMEFCYVDRGNICNFYRMPYQYTFHNNYKSFCQFLYQPDYIAKKSTNIQRPRIQYFLTTSREVQQDNRKNDEMFYNSLQELKEKEIKIYENIKNYNDFKENEKYQQLYTDIQDLFKDKTNKQTQQIESDKEHSSGSGGGKLIKKIKQKDEQLSNHNNNQYEEQSSFVSQFVEDRKITRGRKVIDSDDEYDRKEQRSPEPQVRTTRLRYRDQQQRLTTLNNHRQIRNQDLRRNNRSSNQELCHRCKQQITDGAIKCSECKKGYHKDCAERHLYLSEGDVVKKFCLNCICQSYKKKIVSKNYLTQALREQYLEDNTNLPQIGDMIIFFLKGYESFLQKNLFQLDLSHMQDDSQIIIYPGDKLKDNVFQVTFKVTNIVYIFPTQNNQYKQKSNGQQQQIQQLVFLENDEMSMRCFYTFDSDQFLLLESIYTHSLKCIKPLLQPNVLIQTDQDRDEDIPHQYVFLSFEQQNYDDWQTVQCRKLNDESYQTRKNTQQTINLHMWDIATIINQSKSNKVVEIQAVQLQSALYPYESKQIIQEILNYMKKVVGLNYYFQEPVDIHIYQDYNAFVPLGSFIRLVRRRLESCFYRSKEHIMNDILRMRDNAFLFNAAESDVCVLVEQFYSQLQMIVYSDYVEQQTEIQLRKRRRQ